MSKNTEKFVTEIKYNVYQISRDGLLKLGDTELDYGNQYTILDSDYDTEEEAIKDIEKYFPDSYVEFVILKTIKRTIKY